MATPGPSRHTTFVAAAIVAGVALLPFARGLLAGSSLYFRDLAGYFFPSRLYLVEGLGKGDLRYWNPFSHEGVPMALPPVGYPLDLLQPLWPSEAGLTLLLALHFPLAALGAFALARQLGAGHLGASASGVAYALGGFALSTVNLYVFAQALAWAPFVVRGLCRAAVGTARDVGWAALALATALTTTGVEIVAQTVACGLLLAWPGRFRGFLRLVMVLALGVGLGAAVWLPMLDLLRESARAKGFATDVVLAHSIHPVTLLQTVIAGLYAEPSRFTDTFWGQNFFPRGYPYFLSLYLGALAVGLAVLGASLGTRAARVLAVLAAIGLVAGLGFYAGGSLLVEALPALRRFRFPSKAFFTVHLAVALLLGLAIDRLSRAAEPRVWRRAAFWLAFCGAATGLGPFLVMQREPLRHFLLQAFFPPGHSWELRRSAASSILVDAGIGGLIAAGAAGLACLAARGVLPRERAAALVATLLGIDLLRAGAGLNPMVSPAFYEVSPPARAIARRVEASGGRLFTFDPGYSPAYYAARARRTDHETWSFTVLRETLCPSYNLALHVSTALSPDQTMLVPESQVLAPVDASPLAFPRIKERLREAAVSFVLALEPLDEPDLEPLELDSPGRIAPLRVHLYRLREARPRFELQGPGQIEVKTEEPGRLRLTVDSEPGTRLVVRDTWARGWEASVDGAPAPVERHDGRHCAIALPAGRHEVSLAYSAPGLRAGLALTLASAVMVLALLRDRMRV